VAISKFTREAQKNWQKARENPAVGFGRHPLGEFEGRLAKVELGEKGDRIYCRWEFLTIGGECDGESATDFTGVTERANFTVGRFLQLGYEQEDIPDDLDKLEEFCEEVTKDAPRCRYQIKHWQQDGKEGVNITILGDASEVEEAEDAKPKKAGRKKSSEPEYTAEELEAFLKDWQLPAPKKAKGDAEALLDLVGKAEITESQMDENDWNLVERLPKNKRPTIV